MAELPDMSPAAIFQIEIGYLNCKGGREQKANSLFTIRPTAIARLPSPTWTESITELTDILYQSDREYNSTEVGLKFARSKSEWSRWGKIERSLVVYAASAPSL